MNTKSCHFNNGDDNGNVNNGEIIYAVEHKLYRRCCARYSGVEMDEPCFRELFLSTSFIRYLSICSFQCLRAGVLNIERHI